MGETRTCPPCPAQMCGKRFVLCGRDTLPHTRVRPAPHIRAGSASRYVGETRTCPPCPAHTCRIRFALCGRDAHVSALPRTYVQEALRARWARHARHGICPAPYIRAGSASCYAGETRTCLPCPAHSCGQRFALCDRDTHGSALPRTYMREALRAMQARHARVCPAPHTRAGSASRYVIETRMCPPCPVHTCGKRSALGGRDMHVSALPRTLVRAALCIMWARHARVRPAPHIRAGSASRDAGETRTCPPCPAHSCRKRSALCGRDTQVSALPRT